MKPISWYDWNPDVDTYENREAERCKLCPRLSAVNLEALWQLRVTVWDGYLISKTARDWLVDAGLATRCAGWQVITREGLAVLSVYGLLQDDRYGTDGDGGERLWTLKPHQITKLRAEGWVID
jgi:hypothetical protein